MEKTTNKNLLCWLFFLFLLANSRLVQTMEQHFSTFQKIAEERSIHHTEGVSPSFTQDVESEVECFMQRFGQHFIVEIEDLQETGFQCRFFYMKFKDVETTAKNNTNIYELLTPADIQQEASTQPPETQVVELCQNLTILTDGNYTINPYGTEINVFCDMTRNGGGWTTFQRRFDGSMDFYRDWVDYKEGFGEAGGEYWLGLKHIHQITNKYSPNIMLRIEATEFDGTHTFVIYEGFYIEDESTKYKLHCGTFVDGESSAKDDWLYHDGQSFSTRDQDNENYAPMHCAKDTNQGGGWFNSCARLNFNGIYSDGVLSQLSSMFWDTLTTRRGLQKISLAIRVKD